MTSVLDKIGNTPIVEIKKLNPNPKVTLLAKLESCNPGGSIKDRIAKAMIEAGEASGALTHEKIVLEATSGNTGIGLAMVCAIKGYRLLLTMSEAVSVERRQILQAYGADIMLTPAHLGTDGAIEEAYRLARENPKTYFITDQFNNDANWGAHYHGTGIEIWEQTGGTITKLVATMGTTGTLMGTSKRLKEYNPNIEIVGVEPYLGHKIQGLKNMKESYQPEIYDKKRLDKKINIDDDVAYEMARRLAREEGIFAGMSSGAGVAVACQEAAAMTEGTIVTIICDGGERYLSTPLFAAQKPTSLRFYNVITKKKEAFEPLRSGCVSMFTCGPRVQDHLHVGEGRRFVFADILRRYLEYRGYEVTHAMDITDLHDKTIQASEEAGMDVKPFTDALLKDFMEDSEALGVKPATQYGRASDHLNDMVALTGKVLEKGFAYEKLQSVYFDISRFPDYGRLSGIDLDKIRLGATVDLDEYEKANPRDFTLLKRAKLSELRRGIYTKTEWGNVRPSWHLESVATAMKFLGETFDLYTSSVDFIFPHHENETAISHAVTGKPLTRYWLFSELVLSQGKKAETDPDTPYVRDLFKQGCTGRSVRFWLLSHNYRKPLHFSLETLEQSKAALRRLDQCVRLLYTVKNGKPYGELDQLLYDIKNGFTDAMDNDLDISSALSALFSGVRKINRLIAQKALDQTGAQQILDVFKGINDVLGIFDFEHTGIDPRAEALIRERDAARANKDWAMADQIREKLKAMGIDIKDQKVSS
jgi:cysteinyl-tRNA synthetase